MRKILNTARVRLVTVTVAVTIAVLTPAVAIPAAAAETSPPTAGALTSPSATAPGNSDALYIFWSEWTTPGSGNWTFSQSGAASKTPANGTAQGFRWGVGSTPTVSEQPRIEGNFAAICGNSTPPSGQKRVAVVIDHVSATEAAPGTTPPQTKSACAEVATASNGLQVLSSVSSIRQDPNGMVCGIGGYPPSGCGYPITMVQLQSGASAPVAPATSSSTNSWLSFAIGAIVILIIVVAGVLIARRRKTGTQ